MMIHVTQHACERWIERVDPLASIETARLAILAHEPMLNAAVNFGCHQVNLGCGARLLLKGHTVTTVAPRPPKRHNGSQSGNLNHD